MHLTDSRISNTKKLSTSIISSEKPLRVLIADSQFLISESLNSMLHNEVCSVFNKVVTERSALIDSLNRDNISLLIIDYSLIDISGISELTEIRTLYPDLKILVIINSLSKAELHELNSSGITNVVLKTAGREELFAAIASALKGKKFFSNELLDLLFDADEKKKDTFETSQLTNSEIEIVKLISEGLTTKEIASQKFISYHTVISHRKNIFRKLQVSSVSELLMYSIKAGWINTIEYHI